MAEIVGVALRSSKNLPSTLAILNPWGGFLELRTFTENGQLLQEVQRGKPELIAIGSPLCLPLGLDCLESLCSCRFEFPGRKGRVAELQLASVRISYFFTNKGSIVTPLIYRGIELYARLRELGYNVIEVYPHATKLIVFGDSVPRKEVALPFLREQLPALILGLKSYPGKLNQGACDALMNAYTGVLHLKRQTLSLGDPEEGLIMVPRDGKNPMVTVR